MKKLYLISLSLVFSIISCSDFKEVDKLHDGSIYQKGLKEMEVTYHVEKIEVSKVEDAQLALKYLIETKGNNLYQYIIFDSSVISFVNPISDISKLYKPFEYDTIVMVVPETMEEKINISKVTFDSSSVNTVRLIKGTFKSFFGQEEERIIAACPMRKIYDNYGTYLGLEPLFYIRYE